MTTHKLTVDGYYVLDSLEGVEFTVDIDITDNKATIGAITCGPSPRPGLKVDMDDLDLDVRSMVQSNIDHLTQYIAGENRTWDEELAMHASETGQPGIQVIMEV